MLEALKVIILGIVEGITEWLPISSTGHLILVEEFVKLNFSQSYLDMFNVVIQLGAIMAVAAAADRSRCSVYCDREQTQRKETSDHQDFPDGSSGPDLDRSIPDACYDSGNFPFRSNDHRSTGTGRVKNCSSGFYILSGDSGNGRCQPCKTSSLWI